MAGPVTSRFAMYVVLAMVSFLASSSSCYGNPKPHGQNFTTTSRYTVAPGNGNGWVSGGATWYGSPYGAGSDGKCIATQTFTNPIVHCTTYGSALTAGDRETGVQLLTTFDLLISLQAVRAGTKELLASAHSRR